MAVWLLLFVPKRARDQRLCWLLVVEAKRAPRGPAIGEKRDATVIGSRPAFVSQQELSGLDPAASGSHGESAASARGVGSALSPCLAESGCRGQGPQS